MNESLTSIAEAFAPTLRERGFKRRSTTWNRRIGDFTDVVNLQLSKSLDRVWVNVGVAEAHAFVSSWGRALPGFVPEGECTVRTRLGNLIDGHDSAWMIQDPAAPSDIAESSGPLGSRTLSACTPSRRWRRRWRLGLADIPRR